MTVILFPINTLAGGSSYSRYGFGDILHYGGSRIYAMGGTGIALIGDGFINRLNPAGMTRIAYTRFSGGFEYNRFSSEDTNSSALYSSFGFQGLAFAIPISRENGIVLSFESTPYSAVRYAINRSASTIGTVMHQTFYGSGGLSYLGLGLSASPLNTLHIGARLNYMYGRTRQFQKTTFDDASFAQTEFDRSKYYSGFTITFGTIYEELDNLLNLPSLQNLTVGFTFTSPYALNVDKNLTYSSIDSIVTSHGTSDLPFSLGFGLSYLHQSRYQFAGDIVYENWGSVKDFGSHPAELRSSFRLGLGFEAKPSKDADTYLGRLIYRAGLAYHSTYYKIHGEGIDEFLASGGLGLPIGPDARLNIGLQVGIRGSTNNSLQKDTIIRLLIAVSASEMWFLRFEEE